MFSALCLPSVAAMLDAKTAWRLGRTCSSVQVCWDEICVRTKCKMPKALGAGLCAKRSWTVRGALALLEDPAATPFQTKANLLRYFFRYALAPQQLLAGGAAYEYAFIADPDGVLLELIRRRNALGVGPEVEDW